MSRGIIHTASATRGVFSQTEMRELSYRDISSEHPTLADLILPGTGQPFSEEFTCFLSVLCAKGEPE